MHALRQLILILAICLCASPCFAQVVLEEGAPQAWAIPKTFLIPAAADDYIISYVLSASTISGMHGICVGGTSVSYSLQQCDDDGLSNCADLIADATITSGTKLDFTVADTSIAADKTLKILTGTVTGGVTYCTLTIYGTVP